LAYALATTLVSAATAHAQTPSDLSDLVGARGAGGETQMQARGYQPVRATRARGQSLTYWWSDGQRACVAISTSEGRYAKINGVPEQHCRPASAPHDTPARPAARTSPASAAKAPVASSPRAEDSQGDRHDNPHR